MIFAIGLPSECSSVCKNCENWGHVSVSVEPCKNYTDLQAPGVEMACNGLSTVSVDMEPMTVDSSMKPCVRGGFSRA